jgi:hypothetical protein
MGLIAFHKRAFMVGIRINEQHFNKKPDPWQDYFTASLAAF